MSTLTQARTYTSLHDPAEALSRSTAPESFSPEMSLKTSGIFDKQLLEIPNFTDGQLKTSSTGSTESTAALSARLSVNEPSKPDVCDAQTNNTQSQSLSHRVLSDSQILKLPERTMSNLSLAEMYFEKDDNDQVACQRTFSFPIDEDLCSSKRSTATPQGKSLDTPPQSLTMKQDRLSADAAPLLKAQPLVANNDQGQHPIPTANAPALMALSPGYSMVSSSAASSSMDSPHRHAPVLYSAIGSLEDPATSSYSKQWRNAQRKPTKFEFPSCSLLPPPNTMRQGGMNAYLQHVRLPVQQQAEEKRVSPKQSSLSAELTEIEEKKALEEKKASEEKKILAVKPADATTNSLEDSQANSSEEGLTPEQKRLLRKMASTASTDTTSHKNAAGPSLIRRGSRRSDADKSSKKKVTIVEEGTGSSSGSRRKKKKSKAPTELFRPSSDAYTPRMGKKDLKYKPAEMRTPVQKIASPMGTLSRPNFRDALRRVAMIMHQHIVKIESRFEKRNLMKKDDGLFLNSMKDAFTEEGFVTPKYKCVMVRVPMARPGMVFGLKMIRRQYDIPSEGEIYEFAHQLFHSVQLSSECSIVCLIYVERLMEHAKVPLMACTWRPIFMCGLLLASKVWQDLSSWNIEFAHVYPQYSLDAINRLELLFLRMVKWDLYISSSLYAKYYFALRSVVEKPDFRNRYNRMVGGVNDVKASEARKVEERSTQVKEEALLQLSRSM